METPTAPTACTLTSGDAVDRLVEWRLTLTTMATGSKRVSDQELRIHLRSTPDSPDDLVRVADLASRETACCGFFAFSIAIGVDSNWLVVRVPPDAVPVLDDFASLAPR